MSKFIKKQQYNSIDENIYDEFVDIDSITIEEIDKEIEDFYIDKEKIKDMSAIEQVIFTFIGLFGQAFELKTISIILKCPLYITRPNVIMYLNCFIYVDNDDKERISESNVLFALYQVLKSKNPEQIKYCGDYKKIVESLSKKYNSIDDYVNELKKIVD